MCNVTKGTLGKITHPGLNKVLGQKTVDKLSDPLNLFPNAPKTEKEEEKVVQYLSNVWLDGAASSEGITRNALRMDLGSGQKPTVRLPVVATPVETPMPSPTPPSGLGMRTGGGSPWRNVQTQLR
ncbi:hypothetical protein [Stenotrophomonas muris]|uniref:hypothetical protein n=1 Tax=Stenotrophomonas muris TaxID=2963283 RepID=UPI00405537E9